jgi:serine/threonine protein kinase
MLTGKLPFNVENPIDLFEAVKTQEYVHSTSRSDDRPLIPTSWSHDQADLVKRMLIKNPTNRIRMNDIRVSTQAEQRVLLISGPPMGD